MRVRLGDDNVCMCMCTSLCKKKQRSKAKRQLLANCAPWPHCIYIHTYVPSLLVVVVDVAADVALHS